MAKRILIISYSYLNNDPRVRRQIMLLKDKYKVVAAGFNDPEIDGVDFIYVNKKRKILPKYLRIHHKIWCNKLHLFEFKNLTIGILLDYCKLLFKKYDAIIANDIDTVPLVFKIFNNNRIIIDLHEYHPNYSENDSYWVDTEKKSIVYICKKYLPMARAVSTVCEGLANKYKNEICNRKINVIRNCSDYYSLNPSPVSKNSIKLIHHGLALSKRKIENMIFLMDLVRKEYTLDLMLVKRKQNTMTSYANWQIQEIM